MLFKVVIAFLIIGFIAAFLFGSMARFGSGDEERRDEELLPPPEESFLARSVVEEESLT